MVNPWITDIQKYSIHDGPGIRTTVFFKGCPLRCSWCHNPETQSYDRQIFYNIEKCCGCGQCAKHCPDQAIMINDNEVDTDLKRCSGCTTCMEYCSSGAREFAGKKMEPDELVVELKKDSMFYEESNGGITLSGGEVMTMDMEYLCKVMEPLYRQGYSIGIDTCGNVPIERYREILTYTDFFLYDLKVMDSELHKKYTGVGNEQILENLKFLSKKNAKIYLRIPVITQVNGNKENMIQCVEFLKLHQIHPIRIHLLPYHDIGKSKYDRLRITYQGDHFTTPTQDEMDTFLNIFTENGFRAVIGG